MNVYIDNPRLSKMKNDTKALSFTLILIDPELGHIAITGFRLMDGLIHPPANYSKMQRRYFSMFFATPKMAGKIYQAIKDNNWEELYPIPKLLAERASIGPLLLTLDVAGRIAPSLVPDEAEAAQTV